MRIDAIPALERESYQRAVRMLLSQHLITASYPDPAVLPLVRRHATALREDLAELFGYRLEVTETTARVHPVHDRLTTSRPARTATDRPFDRRRYAYLALALAALGRGGAQITLSELAERVAADARRIGGLELSTQRAADRDAFVDAVGWLAARGAITLADGDASGWAADPAATEALYDVDRAVVVALFRPPRVLQHVGGVGALLTGGDGTGEGRVEQTADVRRRVRRLLAERPVVYRDELDAAAATVLRDGTVVREVSAVTGLPAEIRAEGVALLDHSGRMSDQRFPGTGTVAQVALLLAGELADRALDIDAPELPPRTVPFDETLSLSASLDSAMPRASVLGDFVHEPVARPEPVDWQAPLVPDAWIDATLAGLRERFVSTYAAQWRADPAGLRREALALLERMAMIRRVHGGVLVFPVLARYRGVVVQVRAGGSQTELFEA